MNYSSPNLSRMAVILGIAALAAPATAYAEVTPETQYLTNTLLLLIGGFLVMFMAAGFCMLEAGLVRTSSVTTICLKNVALFAIACVAYALVGYKLMFGGHAGGYMGSFAMWNVDDSKFIDQNGAFIGTESGHASAAEWLFQAMFVGTAASIVSGAAAERMRLWSFLVFTAILSAFIYPIAGSWTWGNGWLGEGGFHDFAGSTLVHSVGGWCALSGIWLIGARKGRYTTDGKSIAMPGSNMPLATMGTFILWFGWFGFNGASVGALASAKDAASISIIFVNTNIAACAGTITAMLFTQLAFKKVDPTITLNGALVGLVSITADPLSPTLVEACIIGAVGALLMTLSIPLLDKLKLDDVVGAIPVHLVGGIWGTMAVPFTNPDANFITQGIGVVAYGAFTFIASVIVWSVIKVIMGLRISEEMEEMGIDRAEVGLDAYPEFVRASRNL